MRKTLRATCAIGAACLVALGVGSRAQAQTAPVKKLDAGISSEAAAKAVPLDARLKTLPPEAMGDKKASEPLTGKPAIHQGDAGQAGQAADGGAPDRLAAPEGGIVPQNYGAGNLGTIYHYTDLLIDPSLRKKYPYRPSGWFVFTAASGGTFRCTATLISKSILVTAGHCVHGGGGGSANYIKSGIFYPAYANGAAPYGSASAAYVLTTSGWYNTGALDQGYDVGLVVLNNRSGTTTEIGNYTGWFSFCYSNCLQSYWYLTQHGYPGNLYNGTVLTQSQHLEASDTRDYVLGSGMQGGSSGGPHIANLGSISDSSTNQGQWPYRNVIFAVTSWGYVDQTLKIQGAPSLSGPGNSNNFQAMFNTMCNLSRGLHGSASCTTL